MASQAALTVEHVEAGYGGVIALQDVSITAKPGTITAVLGANGAGKTTLLATISGLVRARKGRVALDGTNLTRRPPEEIVRAGVAHVPEGQAVITELTVEENLRVGGLRRDRAAGRARRPRRGLPALPGAGRGPQPRRGDAVRRRAADPGDRARPDGQPEGAAAGRAVAGTRPPDRRPGHEPDPAAARRVGADRRAGRAERPQRAGHRRHRRGAQRRPGRRRRERGHARGRRGTPQALPGLLGGRYETPFVSHG